MKKPPTRTVTTAEAIALLRDAPKLVAAAIVRGDVRFARASDCPAHVANLLPKGTLVVKERPTL